MAGVVEGYDIEATRISDIAPIYFECFVKNLTISEDMVCGIG